MAICILSRYFLLNWNQPISFYKCRNWTNILFKIRTEYWNTNTELDSKSKKHFIWTFKVVVKKEPGFDSEENPNATPALQTLQADIDVQAVAAESTLESQGK